MKQKLTVAMLAILALVSLSLAQSLEVKFTVNMAQQANLGNFSADSDMVVVRGNMNGWAGESLELDSLFYNETGDTMLFTGSWITNQPDTFKTKMDSTLFYKFVIHHPSSDGWESMSDNRTWTWDGVTAVVSLDTVWFNEDPYKQTQETAVTFKVDMFVQIAVGNFDPDDVNQHVSVRGGFNGWGETNMTPYDDGNDQTSIYTANVVGTFGLPETVGYKFFIKGPEGTDNWESIADNRTFTVDGTETDATGDGIPDKELETVYFNNEEAGDVFLSSVTISFFVDMSEAVDHNNNSVSFNATTDSVYLAGGFNSWLNSWSPTDEWKLSDSDGDGVYTISKEFGVGTSRNFVYKYGFIGPNVSNMDNEADCCVNHEVRLDGDGPFSVISKFGVMDKDSVTTAIGDGDGAVADKFELRQNYPNPFNPTTTVSFTLDQPSEVSLVIYNMLGQKVKTLYQGKANAGTVTRIWDGMNEAGGRVASGVYFYQLKTENRVVTKKMTLLK